MAQNRPARQVPHSPGQRPGRWGDIKGNCALQGQNHQTCPKGVLSPLCYALALGFAAFVEKELVRFRNNVEKESVSFVTERPLRGVFVPSAILFPMTNTILAKICSLVYAECTLSVYSVYTQRIFPLSFNKLTSSNLQRI